MWEMKAKFARASCRERNDIVAMSISQRGNRYRRSDVDRRIDELALRRSIRLYLASAQLQPPMRNQMGSAHLRDADAVNMHEERNWRLDHFPKLCTRDERVRSFFFFLF